MAKNFWIQGAIKKRGALHRQLGIPARQKIGAARIAKIKTRLTKKAAGRKKLSAAELRLLRRANLAATLAKLPKRGRGRRK